MSQEPLLLTPGEPVGGRPRSLGGLRFQGPFTGLSVGSSTVTQVTDGGDILGSSPIAFSGHREVPEIGNGRQLVLWLPRFAVASAFGLWHGVLAFLVDDSTGSSGNPFTESLGHRNESRVGIADLLSPWCAAVPLSARSGVMAAHRGHLSVQESGRVRFLVRRLPSRRITGGVHGGAKRRSGTAGGHPQTPPMGRLGARSAATQ